MADSAADTPEMVDNLGGAVEKLEI